MAVPRRDVTLALVGAALQPTTLERVYFYAAWHLDEASLGQLDACCRHLRAVNAADRGPWAAAGAQRFAGLELRHDGAFEAVALPGRHAEKESHAVPWKRRYIGFCYGLRAFEAPFGLRRILGVERDSENACLQCLLRTDLLSADTSRGVYIEFEILANPDNFSVCLADFDDGGSCGCFSFSPDTGTVICERKVAESPRRVKGSYRQSLCPAKEPRFHGSVGLLVRAGRLAFFRHGRSTEHSWLCCEEEAYSEDEEVECDGPWETTGFVSDLSWAEGYRLTPCLAFRAAGLYDVRVTHVGVAPPVEPPCDEGQSEWLPMDWEEAADGGGSSGAAAAGHGG